MHVTRAPRTPMMESITQSVSQAPESVVEVSKDGAQKRKTHDTDLTNSQSRSIEKHRLTSGHRGEGEKGMSVERKGWAHLR